MNDAARRFGFDETCGVLVLRDCGTGAGRVVVNYLHSCSLAALEVALTLLRFFLDVRVVDDPTHEGERQHH